MADIITHMADDKRMKPGGDPYRQFIAALEQEYRQAGERVHNERAADAERVAAATPIETSAELSDQIRSAIPANTLRAWDSRMRWLQGWALRSGAKLVPAGIDTIVAVIREHARLDLSPATCQLALWVLKIYNEKAGCPLPAHSEYVRIAKRTHIRMWKSHGNSVRRATMAYDSDIAPMLAVTETAGSVARALRDRVILTLGQKAMTRRSELAALDIEDIVPIPGGIEVQVRRRRIDPDLSYTPPRLKRHIDPNLCPVLAVEAWLACMAEQGITSGPLLRPVDRHGNIRGGDHPSSGPSPDLIRLQEVYLNDILKDHARLAVANRTLRRGIWSPHSLRSGGAAQSAIDGLPAREVALTGGWVPDGETFQGYRKHRHDK